MAVTSRVVDDLADAHRHRYVCRECGVWWWGPTHDEGDDPPVCQACLLLQEQRTARGLDKSSPS